jgi:YesN/AraC family two-component response regulator
MSNSLKDIFSFCKAINVLYVEDNDDARTFTLELLARFFDNIEVAVDGEEGLTLFKQKAIDLVITDVNMPKMGGIKMSAEIRKIDVVVPIILLSAHNETGFKESAYNIGITDYLEKPLKLSEFIKFLENLKEGKINESN